MPQWSKKLLNLSAKRIVCNDPQGRPGFCPLLWIQDTDYEGYLSKVKVTEFQAQNVTYTSVINLPILQRMK